MTDQTVFQLTGNVLVRQSRLYQTNSGAVTLNGKAVVIDPGVYQSDLDAFGTLLQPYQIVTGLITHAHWDHILWAPTLGGAPRYCSIGTDYQMTVNEQTLRAALDQIEADSRGQYGYWERSRFFDRSALTPGVYDLHGFQFEIIELPGHTPDQIGFVFANEGVAFVGDVLSDVEVPSVPNRVAITDYLATLSKLEGVINTVQWVVPGHGMPASQSEALGRLMLDRAYLSKLVSHPGMQNLATNEWIARAFLDELGEQRANSSDAWSMHIENLVNIYGN
jgi:glyoxylase-like metal-dependent hydrolase (beta-lactamase superfamily II)